MSRALTATEAASRYARSLRDRAWLQRVTPGGAQTRSKRAESFGTWAMPSVLTRGEGAHVWDVDGHEYLDCVAGLAAMGLGYAEPSVTEAVIRQATRGASFSLATRLEGELAEGLIAALPSVEAVRFVKTGSEATEAAVRIARRVTGRTRVLVPTGGYHAWHSWFMASKPWHPGVPEAFTSVIGTVPYNDLDGWRTAIAAAAASPEGLAAVLLEPTLNEAPVPGFLDGLRTETRRVGAVLIFDEMVCGFRWRLGGGGEYFAVTPDLSCFGKAMANGYPLACVAGPAALMEAADVISGTFGGEAIGLAAGLATLRCYQAEPIIETLWARGRQVQAALRRGLAATGAPFELIGAPVHPVLRPRPGSPDGEALLALFVQELAARGVLWHPAGSNILARMTPDDVIGVEQGAEEALGICAEAVARGTIRTDLLGTAPAAPVRTA